MCLGYAIPGRIPVLRKTSCCNSRQLNVPNLLTKTMRYYKPGKLNKTAMASLARQTFGCEPFGWQIAVLEGRDVSTGSVKTLAFSLVLVMDKEEIIVFISLLSSLMIEQMDNAPISTVAICREILTRVF